MDHGSFARSRFGDSTSFRRPWLDRTRPSPIPNWVQAFDYELEIAAYIGKRGKNVSREEAREMIVGYACFNDWCIRDPHLVIGAEDFDEGVLSFAFQKNASGASLGPYLAIDEDQGSLQPKMETKVNGSIRQSGLTGEMVFKLDEIVAYLSKYLDALSRRHHHAGDMCGHRL